MKLRENAPRQLALLEKGNRKAYITLRYEVFDADDGAMEEPLEIGEVDKLIDNLTVKVSDISGNALFVELLNGMLETIEID